jgi:pimeloyl-ACP methyl ester carboxylesterase
MPTQWSAGRGRAGDNCSVSAHERMLEWWGQGQRMELSLDGQPRGIFVLDTGDGPPMTLLHGFPSSSHDWAKVAPTLARVHSLLLFDFLGYGASDKPRDHVYSLHGQADLAQAIANRCFPGQPVLVVAHDMGTSVATELLARDVERKLPFELAGVLLTNGSMVLEKASLTISQRILRGPLGPIAARLSNKRGFRAQFARIFSKAHPLSAEEAADQWSLLAYHDGQRILDRLIFYLHERIEYAPRWHGALRDWSGRLELAWAMQDPICTEAVLDAVVALRRAAPVVRFSELGHYPQLEDPRAVADVVDAFARGGPR